MKWYHWLAIPALPLLVALAFVACVLTGRREQFGRLMETELEVIEARAEAKRTRAKLGAEHARQQVEERYNAKLTRLTEEQKARADRLRDDPVALAELLARLSR
jgi:hypothetical protein